MIHTSLMTGKSASYQRAEILHQYFVKFFRILGAQGIPKVFPDVRESDRNATVEQRQSDHPSKQPPPRLRFFKVGVRHIPK